MSRESPVKALLVVAVTALVCSTLVSAAVVILRPIQQANQLLERSRNVMGLTGLLDPAEPLEDEQTLDLFRSLDARVVDISAAAWDEEIDPYTFDERRAAGDPELGERIPSEYDSAGLGRRSRYATAYMVWDDEEFQRIILPVNGSGMWSMLHGFIAVDADLNTIAGMSFYEQNETPGLGDQITHDHWLEQWQGRQIYDDLWQPAFRVSEDTVQPGSDSALHEVDALTGATVTGNAVTGLMQYWFGPHGYGPFLEGLREQPPKPKGGAEG